MHEWKIVGIRRAVCYDGIRSVSVFGIFSWGLNTESHGEISGLSLQQGAVG